MKLVLTFEVPIALALAAKRSNPEGTIKTVDIRDVNAEKTKPRESAKSTVSPLNLIRSLELKYHVSFTLDTAVEQLINNDFQLSGMIFLDGDNSVEAVYRENTLALTKLNDGGVIILHNVYPEGKSIWEEQVPILGPWPAVARFKRNMHRLKLCPSGRCHGQQSLAAT